MSEYRDVYKNALTLFGAESQTWMCVEECSELLNALSKYRRGRSEVSDIITELADVSIMVEQMAELYGHDAFEQEKKRKIERLKQRIETYER